LILSLFCGAGGLDRGFEDAGFDVGLAFDRNADSVLSYNKNRPKAPKGHIADVSTLTLTDLDNLHGGVFAPSGVIGGPPCQSFSQANVHQRIDDPRHTLPVSYARLIQSLNERNPVDFFVMENVVGLTMKKHRETLNETLRTLESAGFHVEQEILDAQNFGTPQVRRRVFLVGFNREKYPGLRWKAPTPERKPSLTVRDVIENLPEPVYFKKGLNCEEFDKHPNHWCMQPKSAKFFRHAVLTPSAAKGRSFKTLAWEKPSFAVAYGHREVHVHPEGKRRLSVYEAMLLQGFPHTYRLYGNLSSQFRQVSEAVPVPLARAVAQSVADQLFEACSAADVEVKRPNPMLPQPSLPSRDIEAC